LPKKKRVGQKKTFGVIVANGKGGKNPRNPLKCPQILELKTLRVFSIKEKILEKRKKEM